MERQNRITQQIFANYIERRLFPNRRSQQKVPTIDDILPTTPAPTPPRRLHSKSARRNAGRQFSKRPKTDDDGKDDDEETPAETLDELFDERETADGEALQSVESKQHDQYYGDEFGNDPAENEIPDGERNLL